MSLRSGARLGPYEIVGSLGAGGMGEVYRARDHRLGRDVAVKALPLTAGADQDRIARFEREAQILASLNHPHIAAIYGLEDAPSSDAAHSTFLILELVEGGTLAERLGRGTLPPREALTVARQIADALQAAHDRGIIHRDLKPANIGLTRDGQVKVLDFGVAKAMVAESDAATAVHATEHGVVLGTARYMSPEQARGLPLDKRTDIWSFGCVVYEALAGRHPFGAETAPDTMVAILNRDPDWSLLPPGTPERVKWLLRRCLDKDPRRRLHDIADARIELDDAIAHPATGESGDSRAAAAPSRVRERVAWAAAAAGILTALGVWIFLVFLPARTAAPALDASALHASIVLPREVRLSVAEDPSSRFALSPDGRRLVVVGTEPDGEAKLWVRPLDGVEAQPLAGTEGAGYPFWSPDSQSIAFLSRPRSEGVVGSNVKLKRIDLATSRVRTLGEIGLFATGSWMGDVILLTPSGASPIHRILASGGPFTAVTALDAALGDVQHTAPFFLPDGRHFLYAVVGSRSGATHQRAVYLGSLDSSEPAKPLLDFGTNAKFANGHVIYVRGGRLMAQRFDLERLQLAAGSDATVIAEGVQDSGSSGAGFSVSESGAIVYQPVVPVPMQLGWFSRAGALMGTLGGLEDYSDVALSLDGSRVAVSLLDRLAGTRDIWIVDGKSGHRERVTSHVADDFAPVWSPGGDRLIFSSARTGQTELFQTSASSTDKEVALPVPGLDAGKFAAQWSADGQKLIFVAGHRILARSDVWVLPMTAGDKPIAFADSRFIETHPRFSPDGRWVSYTSNESGRLEIYVRPASGAGGRQPISVNGGRYPLWRKDGAEMFFLSPDNEIMAAEIRMQGDRLVVGAIRPLFRFQFRRYRLDAYPYAVAPDGQRFLINSLIEETAPPALALLVNWPRLVQK